MGRRLGELLVWLFISFLATFVANSILPFAGGLFTAMICAASVCFKKSPSFLLTILVSFSTSFASGLAMYWMSSYHLMSGVFMGLSCWMFFWTAYLIGLRHPRSV